MGKKSGGKKSGKKSAKKSAKKSGKKSAKKSSKKSSKKGKKSVKVKLPPPPPPPTPEPRPPPLKQGEFICIHIGQAGVRVGLACWELFCLEHGLNLDGTVNQLTTQSLSMFKRYESGIFSPRALLVDTDPLIIDAIKTGSYRELFPTRNLINGNENAANNYAAGFYGVGQRLLSRVMDQLARLAEDCDSLQGIALFRSTGGGTGSGMGSRIIKAIKSTYPNKTILDFNISSSRELAPAIVEPYNAALTTHENLDDVNCSLLFDNKSLIDICRSKLDLPNPTYGNINNVLALVLSGITTSLRFEGSIASNITELFNSLLPQPRLHFPIISYAPITNNVNYIPSSNAQLAAMSFDRNYQMINVDPMLGKYQSVCTMFRGDLNPTSINTTVAFMQREQSIPVTGDLNSPIFKFGLCYRPPATLPCNGIITHTKTITSLCNNTVVKYHWMNMMENYSKLLAKQAYLHHYIEEGMEEATFRSAHENISNMIAEYEAIENP